MWISWLNVADYTKFHFISISIPSTQALLIRNEDVSPDHQLNPNMEAFL
jgi:hypothetical protein